MSNELIQRLVERRQNVWSQAQEILSRADDEARGLSGEEESAWQAANADLDSLDQRIKSLLDAEQRAADTAAAFDAVKARPVDERHAPEPTGDEAAMRYFTGQGGRTFEARAEGRMGTAEFRTLSKLSAGAGANTVKISFYDQLVAHMIEVSGILKAGPTVLNTSSGEQIQVPKTTSHSTAALVAEAGTIGASDPAFGQVPLDAYKYAFLIQVSNELLTDTSVDLLGYLAMQSGRALGNALGTHLITGTGSSQPNGVVTAATSAVTGGTGVSGAFSYDNLVDLYFSIIAPYRDSASCGWLMKDSSLATARKIKDSQNRPLWEPSVQAGTPDTLLGKPVWTDPHVAAVALNAKSVLFGDFSQYFVRLAGGVRFERSDDYAFNTDLVTYRAILRGDGDLVDTTGAIKYFTGAAS